ncbi:MAG: GH92 family glycosyl hydrolase [Marinifilaceae bacterium]
MKHRLLIFLSLIIGNLTLAQEPVDYVNPFIGTANFGATYPGPVAPSGMVSVVPYNVGFHKENTLNTDVGWLSNPYVNHNKVLSGFTHVNLSGVGCPDFGSIILMPTTGELNVNHKEYGTHYSDEIAQPGYYSTHLDRYNVKTEMTATTRTGLSRYTFPKGEANILLNLGLGLTNEAGAMTRIVSDTEIEGYKLMGTFCYNPQAVFPVYFVVKFSKPAKEFGYWKKQKKLEGPRHNWSSTSGQYKLYQKYQKELAGDDIGVYFRYNTEADEAIEVKVGVSYVSIENARENLEAEQIGFEFDKIRNRTHQDWNQLLSRIQVEGGTHEDKVNFYTALYHILLHPNVLQDVNGEYPAMESAEIRTVEKGNRYTVFSLWDTYRNVHPFLSLVYPERQLDMVRSMLDMYRESGWLPKWELYSRETNVMEGDPAIPVIVDTWKRGLRDFDVNLAYEAMVKSATTAGEENLLRPDIDHYLSHGYVPLVEEFDNSVSHALEYYIADWNLAQLAKELGHEADYKRFLKQSMGYRNYFDKEYKMLRPKLADGKFLTPFDPKQGENFTPCPGFHEGTAWQYTFYVPHDIKGLILQMGGSRKFVTKLQKVFDENLFDMANEPDITYPYLFNYVKGEEWRTQKEVNRLLKKYYKNEAGGLPGNDDTGTLSTWLVYSMMGLYPVCPGDMDYALAAPVFERITISLDSRYYSQNKIVIEAPAASPENRYIKSIMAGEKKWRSYFISHQELLEKGKLKFELGKQSK